MDSYIKSDHCILYVLAKYSHYKLEESVLTPTSLILISRIEQEISSVTSVHLFNDSDKIERKHYMNSCLQAKKKIIRSGSSELILFDNRLPYDLEDELLFTQQMNRTGIAKLHLRMNGYLFSCFMSELKRSTAFKNNFYNNIYKWIMINRITSIPFGSSNNYSFSPCSLIFLKIDITWPKRCIIDKAWNYRLKAQIHQVAELEKAMAWLSTLGGAFSALGDHFVPFAEQAGKISLKQMKVALLLGDPITIAKCKVYLAMSLVQLSEYKQAKELIRNQFRFAKSPQGCNDIRLINMCKAVWSRLQYLYKEVSVLEDTLREALNSHTLKSMGTSGGGCINEGQGYVTDHGKIFVKRNPKDKALLMFEGEQAGLLAISATNTVRCPTPIKVLENPCGGAVIIMEYLDFGPLGKYSSKLGEDIARLHLFNEELGKKLSNKESSINNKTENGAQYVSKFGFHTTTCCGYIPQDNNWSDDWVAFYARQKLQPQIDLIEKEYGDREVTQLWSELQVKIPEYFKDIEIKPALLHGDLWGGNVAELAEGAVVFDPATFYGHSEFELSIAGMFGGFNTEFYSAYHALVSKATGFQKRQKLYQLFHYLNHWNHFGTVYRGSSVSAMKVLISSKKQKRQKES